MLHYFNRFLAFSLAPLLYNLGIIFGILFLVPVFGLYGLAWGVVLGAVFHWLVQLPAAAASGFKYIPSFNFRYPGMGKLFRLMIPRSIGSGAWQINLIVITAIASTLGAGSVAIFNLANNLQYVPIGLAGISFALATFPRLSYTWANNLRKEFVNTFSSSFRQILFVIIPASVLIFLLRGQIVKVILEPASLAGLTLS